MAAIWKSIHNFEDNYTHPKIHAIGIDISVVETATAIKIKDYIAN